jgi:hypothetical protein
MGMAMSLAQNVFTPLAPLLSWFLAGSVRPAMKQVVAAGASVPQPQRPVTTFPALRNAPAHRPLRVVRVTELGQPRRGGGRIVISGRMADVCAELDRLAALESGLH